MDESANKNGLPKNQLIGQAYSHATSFIGYAYRMTQDWDASRDIFQEACLIFLTSPATFPAYPPAAGYISRTMFTIALDYLKRQSRMVPTNNLPEIICEPEIEWQKELLIGKLRQAIDELSLGESRILAIHMLSGFSLCQKSKLAQLPASTYRFHVGRVIAKLKKRLTTIKSRKTADSAGKEATQYAARR